MSTQPPEPAVSASATEEKDATAVTKPLRPLVALALIGVEAVLLVLAAMNMIIDSVRDGEDGNNWYLLADNTAAYDGFTTTLALIGENFSLSVNAVTIALPLIAVLLVTHIKPMTPNARVITQVAVIEYVGLLFLGAVALLCYLIGYLDVSSSKGAATTNALGEAAILALPVVTFMIVFKVYQKLFGEVTPAGYAATGYGQQYGYGQYAQPGFGQYGQAQQPAGYGQQTQQAAYGQQAGAAYGQAQQAYGQPGQQPAGYGQQPQQTPYGQQARAPQSAPPYQATNQPAGPAAVPPASPPFATYVGPTSAPPAAMQSPEDDRTQTMQPGTNQPGPQQGWVPPQQQ